MSAKTKEAVVGTFRAWFIEQYGVLPTDGKLSQLSIELEHAQRKVRALAEAMRVEERLHEKWQDALYGWNANAHAKSTKPKGKL